MKKTLYGIFAFIALSLQCVVSEAQNNVIDEIVWVVGDEAICPS